MYSQRIYVRLAILAAAAMLAASCSSNDGDQPNPAPVDIDTDDVDEQVLDAIESISDPTARMAFADLDELTRHVRQPCEGLAEWVEIAETVPMTVDAAVASILGVDDELQWIGSEQAALIVPAFEQRLVDGPECGDADGTSRDATWSAAVGVVAATETLRNELLPAENGRARSKFWFNSDVLGHTSEALRLVEDEGGADILIAGDSTVKQGFDPVAITARSGRSTMNVGVNGMLPALVGPWLSNLGELEIEPSTVVIGLPAWSTLIPCGDMRSGIYSGTVSARVGAFAGIELLASIEPQARVSGGTTIDPTGPLIEEYGEHFSERGTFEESADEAKAEALDAQRDYYSTLLASSQSCDETLEEVRLLLTELVASGKEVVLVMMPATSEVRGFRPDGVGGLSEMTSVYEVMAEQVGANYRDLTKVLADDQFFDLAHAGPSGRSVLTAEILAALGP